MWQGMAQSLRLIPSAKLAVAKADTNRVKLLNQIADFYHLLPSHQIRALFGRSY